MTDNGIGQMLRCRAKQAGLEHLHPHVFRHTFAHRWLADGGQEQDLAGLRPMPEDMSRLVGLGSRGSGRRDLGRDRRAGPGV
jgi:hypothetical protein